MKRDPPADVSISRFLPLLLCFLLSIFTITTDIISSVTNTNNVANVITDSITNYIYSLYTNNIDANLIATNSTYTNCACYVTHNVTNNISNYYAN